MKQCPECGRPMSLHRDGHIREWRCVGWYSLGGDICRASQTIPADKALPVAEIAEDMARHFATSSTDRRNEQANYRRLAGGLGNLASMRYLSARESEALSVARDILERLATAAERAKRDKHRQEKDEQQRKAQRHREAANLARDIFAGADLAERALNTLALAEVLNRHGPWSAGWVRRAGEDVDREINAKFNHLLCELISEVSWRIDPVPAMLDRAHARLVERRECLRDSPLLEELRDALALRNAENVTPLHCKPRR